LYQNLGLPKPASEADRELVGASACELDALEQRKELALENFKKGDGIIIHQHIRHCGGTLFCKLVREHTTCPNGIWKGKWMSGVPIISSSGWEGRTCWPYNLPVIKEKLRKREPILESDLLNRPGFPPVKLHSLEMTFNSEMPFHSGKLTWVTVIRDPITRIFGRGIVDKFNAYYPAYYAKRWEDEKWIDLEKSTYSDNWLIKWFLGMSIVGNEAVTRGHLEQAKSLLREFTFVLILEWMPESFSMLCRALEWKCTPLKDHQDDRPGLKDGKGVRKLLKNDTKYAEIIERNEFDIEFYHYAVELNLQQLRRYGEDTSRILSRKPNVVYHNVYGPDYDVTFLSGSSPLLKKPKKH